MCKGGNYTNCVNSRHFSPLCCLVLSGLWPFNASFILNEVDLNHHVLLRLMTRLKGLVKSDRSYTSHFPIFILPFMIKNGKNKCVHIVNL